MNVRLTSAEVVARTGITPRQLQWWDEQGIVVPEREGHRRLYGLDEVAEIALICDLRRRGFSLQRVRKVVRLLQKEFKKRLVDTVSVHSEFHLLTDGRRIYLKNSAEQVVDVLKNSRQPMLTVCLSDTVRQLRTELTGVATGGIGATSPEFEMKMKPGRLKTAGRGSAKRIAV